MRPFLMKGGVNLNFLDVLAILGGMSQFGMIGCTWTSVFLFIYCILKLEEEENTALIAQLEENPPNP